MYELPQFAQCKIHGETREEGVRLFVVVHAAFGVATLRKFPSACCFCFFMGLEGKSKKSTAYRIAAMSLFVLAHLREIIAALKQSCLIYGAVCASMNPKLADEVLLNPSNDKFP